MRVYVQCCGAADKSNDEKRGKAAHRCAEDSKPDEQIRMQRANYEHQADKIGNKRASGRAYNTPDKGR